MVIANTTVNCMVGDHRLIALPANLLGKWQRIIPGHLPNGFTSRIGQDQQRPHPVGLGLSEHRVVAGTGDQEFTVRQNFQSRYIKWIAKRIKLKIPLLPDDLSI